MVPNTLKAWRHACPKGPLGLVFPNGKGNVESRSNIRQRGLIPTLEAAGLGRKYTRLHALRHFYALWCINRKADGGLELPRKIVQERLGHETLAMTTELYGHLFPRADDAGELAAGEAALLGAETAHGPKLCSEFIGEL